MIQFQNGLTRISSSRVLRFFNSPELTPLYCFMISSRSLSEKVLEPVATMINMSIMGLTAPVATPLTSRMAETASLMKRGAMGPYSTDVTVGGTGNLDSNGVSSTGRKKEFSQGLRFCHI